MGDDYYEYARVAGARIHSDSWGWSAKQYSQSVYEIDEFVARNPSFLPMFALGNDGKYTQSVYEYHGGAQHVYETCPWCTKQEIMDGLCPWCTKVDYTDGRYSFGAPANAKNILGVGATLSSNSGPITSTSEDTNVYEVDIGGPMGKHWEHFKIRGYGGLADLTSPPGGSHAIDQVDVAVADPLDACDALTSDMSGKLALIQRGTCAFATKVQNAVDAGAVAVMIFNHHYLSGPIPFMSGSGFEGTTSTIPVLSIPQRDGSWLAAMVDAYGGLSVGVRGPIPLVDTRHENLASFTSGGPTLDGRMKPEVVSPGDNIISAKPLTDADVASGETCGTEKMSGTSMATPVAAGAMALLRQYFTDGFYPSGTANCHDGFEPSAALMRAVVINGAQTMTGFEQRYAAMNGVKVAYAQPIEPAPSPRQGWGRVDLAKSVPLPHALNLDESTTVSNLAVLDKMDEPFTAPDQSRGVCVYVTAPTGEELRATLAWTDPPASTVSDGSLVNDLDLILHHLPEDTGSEPAQLWPLQNTAVDTWDGVNNAERIVWSSPDVGRYWVEANAWSLDGGDQAFALAVTGEFERWGGDDMTREGCLTHERFPAPPAAAVNDGPCEVGEAAVALSPPPPSPPPPSPPPPSPPPPKPMGLRYWCMM